MDRRIRKIPVGAPTGVNIAAILTMLSAVAFGYLYFTSAFQNAIILTFSSAGQAISSAISELYLIFGPMFALFGLAVSIVLLAGKRSKYLWYGMVIYLVLLFGFFAFYERDVLSPYGSALSQMLTGQTVNWAQFGGPYQFIEAILIYLTPFIFSLGGIGYLFTELPKKYFCIDQSEENLSL